jgi:prevent-host-death family protein
MSWIVNASEFRAKCLALMNEVERTGRGVLITKNGKPIAELRPVAEVVRRRPRKRNALGIWKGRLFVTGDIISPIDVEWNALK